MIIDRVYRGQRYVVAGDNPALAVSLCRVWRAVHRHHARRLFQIRAEPPLSEAQAAGQARAG
jgi:hypothetical protein